MKSSRHCFIWPPITYILKMVKIDNLSFDGCLVLDVTYKNDNSMGFLNILHLCTYTFSLTSYYVSAKSSYHKYKKYFHTHLFKYIMS